MFFVSKGNLFYVYSNIAPDAWFQYFNNLTNIDGIDKFQLPEDSILPPVRASEFSEPITMQKIRSGIKSIKNNTSVGSDCISNEMLKHSSSSMLHAICKLFNLIYESGHYPSDWSESFIKPLFKSGFINNLSNFRGISI